MNKSSRFNKVSTAVTLASVVALGSTACSETSHMPNEDNSKANISNRIKLDALKSAQVILKALSQPEVQAIATNSPGGVISFGNLDNANNTTKPNSFVELNQDANTLYISSVSKTQVDKAGNPTVSETFNFDLINNNPLLINKGKLLTPTSLEAALADPNNVKFVYGSATSSYEGGIAIAEPADRIKVHKGFHADAYAPTIAAFPSKELPIATILSAEHAFEATLAQTTPQLVDQLAS